MKLKKILELNFIKTFRYKFYVFKKSSINVSNSSKLNINGRILFNQNDSKVKNYNYSYLNIEDGATFNVSKNFIVRPGCRIEALKDAQLEIGDCSINYNSKIYCFNSIKIGNDVIISEDVMIRDSDNHKINGKLNNKKIIIGDHVWICAKATILSGVKIGNGSVVAAGSVVTGDIPENCLVAGVPAKIIKTNISWER